MDSYPITCGGRTCFERQVNEAIAKGYRVVPGSMGNSLAMHPKPNQPDELKVVERWWCMVAKPPKPKYTKELLMRSSGEKSHE
ncbi:MAG: hypothetical protein ACR2RE_04335 [Geminicoccaceae bacterium]